MTATMIPQWSLADRLAKARHHAGLDQQQLADKLEMSLKSISRYECGSTNPKRAIVLGWALACGVDPEWLVRGDQPDTVTATVTHEKLYDRSLPLQWSYGVAA